MKKNSLLAVLFTFSSVFFLHAQDEREFHDQFTASILHVDHLENMFGMDFEQKKDYLT